ncbi:hypothetical protein HZS_6336 [Henneguya salminicola]|nr:hypothetical protein HZS_6336 [Henneguya salminicola]
MGISKVIVASLGQNLRKLVSDTLDFKDIIIGDNGILVEIDEAKLRKAKYHQWHIVDGAWILGNSRHPDSNHSDTYITLFYFPYKVLSILFQSQSIVRPFYYPNSGVCTTTIEGIWNSLK